MKYKIEYDKKAIKQLSKIDKPQRDIILKWIKKNLHDTENPRQHGKELKGNFKTYWRYRVGKYRIISKIEDDKLIIGVINIGHRSEVYNNRY